MGEGDRAGWALGWLLGHRQGQLEGEAGTLARLRLDPDRAADPLDQLPGDGEAEAGATELTVPLVLDLVELAEDMAEMLRRDADTSVFDRHPQGMPAGAGIDADDAD